MLQHCSQKLISPGHTEVFLSKSFGWASIDNSTIVDVGAGTGGVSMQHKKDFKKLSFVVQGLQSQ
jgi:tRNA1(Val) A37 N6-methylase TrmN6